MPWLTALARVLTKSELDMSDILLSFPFLAFKPHLLRSCLPKHLSSGFLQCPAIQNVQSGLLSLAGWGEALDLPEGWKKAQFFLLHPPASECFLQSISLLVSGRPGLLLPGLLLPDLFSFLLPSS